MGVCVLTAANFWISLLASFGMQKADSKVAY